MLYDMKKVIQIRNQYPVGAKICIDKMEDYRPIENNVIGTVKFVDDLGTIHCVFEDGRVLGVVVGQDQFHLIE